MKKSFSLKNPIRLASLIAIVSLFLSVSLSGCGSGNKGNGPTPAPEDEKASIEFTFTLNQEDEEKELQSDATSDETINGKSGIEEDTKALRFILFAKNGSIVLGPTTVEVEDMVYFKKSNHYKYLLEDVPLTTYSIRIEQYNLEDKLVGVYVKKMEPTAGEELEMEDPYFEMNARILVMHKTFQLTPKFPKINVGDTVSFELVATVNDEDNVEVLQDMAELCTWSLDNLNVLTPKPNTPYSYIGRALGHANVTATYYANVTSKVYVEVYDTTVNAIEITVPDQTVVNNEVTVGFGYEGDLGVALKHDDGTVTYLEDTTTADWDIDTTNYIILEPGGHIWAQSTTNPGEPVTVSVSYLNGDTKLTANLKINVN